MYSDEEFRFCFSLLAFWQKLSPKGKTTFFDWKKHLIWFCLWFACYQDVNDSASEVSYVDCHGAPTSKQATQPKHQVLQSKIWTPYHLLCKLICECMMRRAGWNRLELFRSLNWKSLGASFFPDFKRFPVSFWLWNSSTGI